MYLTALHVRSAAAAAEGINAFLHLHTDASFPPGTMNAALITQVAESCPGILTEQSTQLRPGGNQVHSYLDVVAPDGTDLPQLRSALRAFQSALPAESLPLVRTYHGTIGVMFNANITLWPTMATESLTLSHAIERLLDRWEANPHLG